MRISVQYLNDESLIQWSKFELYDEIMYLPKSLRNHQDVTMSTFKRFTIGLNSEFSSEDDKLKLMEGRNNNL